MIKRLGLIALIGLVAFLAGGETLFAFQGTAVHKLNPGSVRLVEYVPVFYIPKNEYSVFGVRDRFPFVRSIQFSHLDGAIRTSPRLENKAGHFSSGRAVASEIRFQIKCSNARLYPPSQLMCRRLAGVLDSDIDFNRSILFERYCRSKKVNIGPQLAFGAFLGFLDGGLGGFRGFLRFVEHPLGVIGSAPRMVQGTPNEKNSSERQDYRRDGCPKHEFCPMGHPLLGFQIAYFFVFGALALGGAFLSYQIANRGLDLIERGRYLFGGGLCLLALISGPTFAGVLPAFGYWLVFEGGVGSLLGIG